MSRSDDTLSDGGTDGQTPETIFNRVSEVSQPTRKERLAVAINEYVVVPGRVILGDIRGVVGVVILVCILLMGTVGVRVVPEPTVMDNPVFAPPFQSMEYPLGTASLGQEIHRQIIHTTPAMLEMVFAGAAISVVLGTAIGTIAGYKSGKVDYFLMLLSDTMLSIPALVLVIVIAATYTPRDPFIVGLLLGINFWPGLARTVRSEVLSLREESSIEAARVMGLSDAYIIRKYVVRNLMPYITVNAANSSRLIIFESVALYFIGILPRTGAGNWGVMMDQAYNNSDLTDLSQIHWLVVPMLMIVILTLGIILLAQAMDQLFNVKLMARQKGDTDDDPVTMENM